MAANDRQELEKRGLAKLKHFVNNLDCFEAGHGSEVQVFPPIAQGKLVTESSDIDRAKNFLMDHGDSNEEEKEPSRCLSHNI